MLLETYFGGGKSADVTTTNIYLQGGTADNIFGGSNTNGTVTRSNVTVTSGTADIIYGGNNEGGRTNESHIQTTGGRVTTAIYGGGKGTNAATGDTYVVLTSLTNTIPNVFGGGQLASATNTNITIQGVNATNVFGGSNTNGTVTRSNVTLSSGTITNLYGGNNDGGRTIESHVQTTGGTVTTAIYGGGQGVNATTDDTYVVLTTLVNTVPNLLNVCGGGQSASATNTHVTMQGVNAKNVFGGSNTNGAVTTSNVIIQSGEIENVYGGNNAGGITTNANVTINGGNISKVYGGGDQAQTNATNTTINNGTIGNAYGGGNAAPVNSDTSIIINGGTITTNAYGGGDEGIVSGNTNMQVSGATVGGSVYGGGNGITAIVSGNTNITIDDATTIGTTTSIAPQSGCVFGGGNAAATGTEGTNSSTSTVNIVGGNMYGNVYGGANTARVYGATHVNIGYEAVGNINLTKTDIYIKGTIFGGGEANAAGSEIFDFDFISVTGGIVMNINATGHTNFETEGSILGSGNASSSRGASYINITNYGNIDNPEFNTSIQRATTVTLNNSSIALSGARDRTNEYQTTLFSLSRIDELKLKNSSSLYLNYGVNLVKKFSSLVDINNEEVKATITIDSVTGDITRNTDNRIYMREGSAFNVATQQNINASNANFGPVEGMTFLGMFTNPMNPATSTGFYNHTFDNQDEITNTGTFVSYTYVRALHKHNPEHNIQIDGFYSNYNNEGYIETKYIDVTPPDDLYYIWRIGEEMDVTVLELTFPLTSPLIASKYVTMGTTQLSLFDFAAPNTQFVIIGFSSGLIDGISLIDHSQIPSIAETNEIANTQFGLTMKTGKNGWKTNSSTSFYTSNGGSYTGDIQYDSENSPYAPVLNFCFYHSQNITEPQTLGTVTIRLQAIIPIDDLTNDFSYIDIVIPLETVSHQDNFYEAAISPGEEFELFATTETDITDSSIFSTYYSLLINNFSTSEYYDDYSTYYRTIVSRNSYNGGYAFSENTKIVMLDLATNDYYYYVVSAQDEANNKYIYRLSDFIKMGSTNEHFDEQAASSLYYNTSQNLAYENYIFHVDFTEANILNDAVDNTLFMELHEAGGQTIIGVLGINRETVKYSVYTNKNSTIDISAVTDKNTMYLGQNLRLDVSTNFVQPIDPIRVYDTKYFDNQMGIKITFYDSNNNQLNIDSLLGINFIIDNIAYYPRIDGTTRIKIAERVSNVLSRIRINTANNTTLNTGVYTIKIESFGSPDGIYYGLEASDYTTAQVTIINGAFGLKVTTENNAKIINKDTGYTLNGNNSLITNINYSSSLTTPIITASLYRRNYSEIYSQNYEKVDLTDYITNTFTASTVENEYIVIQNPALTNTVFMNLTNNLTTGTYKLTYKLYNGTAYIGETYEYLIIK